MSLRTAVILAAGQGTRMKSHKPKVAHELLGKPMINWVLDAARAAGCDDIVVVTGHRADLVEPLVPGERVVHQDEQLGTGHAVLVAKEAVASGAGSVVVLSGDTPLISADTIRALVEARESARAAAAVLTMNPDDPSGYGRVVRDADGALTGIVEEKDASEEEKTLTECNTGIYCFDAELLFDHLGDLGTGNAQGEYYLTDMVRVFGGLGLATVGVATDDASETLGVNTRVQLADLSARAQKRINTAHMLAGVTFLDPGNVWIGPDVAIGKDTEILPLTIVTGFTSIGEGCLLGPNTRIDSSRIGDGCSIVESIVVESDLGDTVEIGPRAYLRPNTHMGDRSKAGCHVEIKNSTIGPDSKVPHLAYVGDTTMGTKTNIGAGVITCNYDGVNKSATTIGDGVFIGSDTMLIAPVTIGNRAVTAAGSAIAEDVPERALAIERSEQITIPGWIE